MLIYIFIFIISIILLLAVMHIIHNRKLINNLTEKLTQVENELKNTKYDFVRDKNKIYRYIDNQTSTNRKKVFGFYDQEIMIVDLEVTIFRYSSDEMYGTESYLFDDIINAKSFYDNYISIETYPCHVLSEPKGCIQIKLNGDIVDVKEANANAMDDKI